MTKWYEKNNENSDIVISTRIRLARNLRTLPFGVKMTAAQQQELINRVKTALSFANLGNNKLTCINAEDLSEAERYSLVERHLVSREFVKNPKNRMVALSEDNSISIMVNEEDHIRIQVLSGGMELENSFKLCNMLDDLLNEQLGFAFDEKFGYLTSCPTNMGTGLRASMMLHLPALTMNGGMQALIKIVGRLGLTIRGTYGEGSEAEGAVYQLSNQVTLGLSEENALQNLKNVATQVITAERQAEQSMAGSGRNEQLVDKVMRSYGVLKYSHILSTDEFNRLSSYVRLGISLSIIKDIDIQKINKLYQQIGSATICAADNKNYDAAERDIIRARLVRESMG